MKPDIKLCECGCGEPAPISTYTSRCIGRYKGQPIRFINGHSSRGKNNAGYKHGLHHHPLVRVLEGMKNRCYNPKQINFENYGDRGISICDEWRKNTESFVLWGIAAGWKPGLEIDKTDNNGNYCPGNCTFVTRAINVRKTIKRKGCTSKYVGVYFKKQNGRFMASININKKCVRLGGYSNEHDAIIARDKYILKHKPEGFVLQVLEG